CLEQYLITQPHGTDAYQLWMNTLRQLGKGASVIGGLEKYAERDPHNVALKLLLAQEYANASQVARAEILYQTLTQESPSTDVFRGLFALLQRQQSDLAGPKKILTLLDDGF